MGFLTSPKYDTRGEISHFTAGRLSADELWRKILTQVINSNHGNHQAYNGSGHLGGIWMLFPCSSSRAAPAAVAQRQCWASREFLAWVGVSAAAPSEFFSGENSSSLRTSNTTKFLQKQSSEAEEPGSPAVRKHGGTIRTWRTGTRQTQTSPSLFRWVWSASPGSHKSR